MTRGAEIRFLCGAALGFLGLYFYPMIHRRLHQNSGRTHANTMHDATSYREMTPEDEEELHEEEEQEVQATSADKGMQPDATSNKDRKTRKAKTKHVKVCTELNVMISPDRPLNPKATEALLKHRGAVEEDEEAHLRELSQPEAAADLPETKDLGVKIRKPKDTATSAGIVGSAEHQEGEDAQFEKKLREAITIGKNTEYIMNIIREAEMKGTCLPPLQQQQQQKASSSSAGDEVTTSILHCCAEHLQAGHERIIMKLILGVEVPVSDDSAATDAENDTLHSCHGTRAGLGFAARRGELWYEANGVMPIHLACVIGKEAIALAFILAYKTICLNTSLLEMLEESTLPSGVMTKARGDIGHPHDKKLLPLICIQNAQGWTSLHFAASVNRPLVVQRILETFSVLGGAPPDDHRVTHNPKAADARHHWVDIQNKQGSTALHLAVASRSTDATMVLIQQGHPNVHIADRARKQTALHMTMFSPKHSEAMFAVASEILENCKADPNVQDADGKTPLHIGLGKGHGRLSLLLVQYGASSGTQDIHSGVAPIHLAAAADDSAMLDVLFKESDADEYVELRDLHERTPLIVAAMRGATKTVSLLLARDARINAKDKDDVSAILWALRGDHPATAMALLSHKRGATAEPEGGSQLQSLEVCDIHITDHSKETPLHLAAHNGKNCTSVAEYLIEKLDADVNAVDVRGRTALHWACAMGDAQLVTTLLEFGANVPQPFDARTSVDTGGNVESSKADTALHWAAGSGSVDVVEMMLVEYTRLLGEPEAGVHSDPFASNDQFAKDDVTGANEDASSAFGVTSGDSNSPALYPLHVVNLQDQHGRTPLMWAVSKYGDTGGLAEHKQVVKFLVGKCGADFNGVEDDKGRTAKDIAKHHEVWEGVLEKLQSS